VVPERGPRSDTSLGSARGFMLRPIEHAIGAFLDETGERRPAFATDVAAE
jgi:hypothetical protein